MHLTPFVSERLLMSIAGGNLRLRFNAPAEEVIRAIETGSVWLSKGLSDATKSDP